MPCDYAGLYVFDASFQQVPRLVHAVNQLKLRFREDFTVVMIWSTTGWIERYSYFSVF